MASNVTIKFDVPKIKQSLSLISKKVSTALVEGLNDSAFALRTDWIILLGSRIKGATPFTKKVFVTKATSTNLVSTTFIPPIQSEYLHYMIEGGTRKPGEIGSLNKSLLIPAGAKLNKYGNLKDGPRRWFGGLEKNIKNSFVGKPRGDKGNTAVYQRMKNGKLKLLAIFSSLVEYKATLPIDDHAEKFSKTADAIMQKKLREV